MATIYRCKRCGISIPRAEERQRHLHWHQITDKKIDDHFTEEQQENAPTAPAAAARAAGAGSRTSLIVAIVVIAVAVAAVAMLTRGGS